ncbi:hypothetical protein B0H14DRAFT_3046206, partial [Mycena olivaceomarginata]
MSPPYRPILCSFILLPFQPSSTCRLHSPAPSPCTTVAGVLPSTVPGRRRTLLKRRSSCDACKEVTVLSWRKRPLACPPRTSWPLPRIRQVCHPVRSGCRRGQAAAAAISSAVDFDM